MTIGRWTIVVLLVFFGNSFSVEAQTPTRNLRAAWSEGRPEISFDLSSMIDDHIRTEVNSGLSRTLAIQILAYRRAGGRPIAAEQVTVHVLYDLWEDVYRVQRTIGDESQTVRARNLESALAACFTVTNQSVGQASDWAAHSDQEIYFAVVAEFNPVSSATVRQVRRLISRRNSQSLDNATVGSFVSLFVNRQIGEADRVLRFRSRFQRAGP